MIGLGLGIHKSNNVLSALKLLTRNSDWAIWGDKASGQSFPTLAERTLPNGVKNDAYVKRVSDNYVLKSTDVTILATGTTNIDYVRIPTSTFVGINNAGVSDSQGVNVTTSVSIPALGDTGDSITTYWKHYFQLLISIFTSQKALTPT